MIGVRRQYRDVSATACGGGTCGALSRTWAGGGSGPPLPGRRQPLVGPTLGTLVVTYRCDLRCRVCDLPQRARRATRRGARGAGHGRARAGAPRHARHRAAGGHHGRRAHAASRLQELLALRCPDLGLHMHLNTDGFRVAGRRRGPRGDGDPFGEHLAGRRHGRGARPGAGPSRRLRDGHGPVWPRSAARAVVDRAPRLTAVTVLTAGESASRRGRGGGRTRGRRGSAGRDPRARLRAGGGRAPRTPSPGLVRSLRRLHAGGVLDNSLAYLDLLPRALRGEDESARLLRPACERSGGLPRRRLPLLSR